MTRVAIYEPDPRICGPDAWCAHLRDGFREAGAECDVVTFTKSGEPSVRWGRVVRDRGSGQSCSLRPDKVFKTEMGGAALDDYDLVVLSDVKCPTQDLPAYKRFEWPEYLNVLAGTETRWTSALHGKWYFDEGEEPKGVGIDRGSPYLAELIALNNFSGFLIEHAADGLFCAHSSTLRNVRRRYLPLPYKLRVPDEDLVSPCDRPTLCSLGRVTKIKFRHYVNHLAIHGKLPAWQIVYAGGSSCQTGPNESYQLYEQLTKAGWIGQREGGAKSASPWTASRNGTAVHYLGMYQEPRDAALGAHVHVGLTDGDFSGGLLEFSTLEAIDCGCVPVISRPFAPPYAAEMSMGILERHLHGHHGVIRDDAGMQVLDTDSDPLIAEICEELLVAILEAKNYERRAAQARNREALVKHHDPALHAAMYLEECL